MLSLLYLLNKNGLKTGEAGWTGCIHNQTVITEHLTPAVKTMIRLVRQYIIYNKK